MLTITCDSGLEGLLTGLYWFYQVKADGLCVKEHYMPNMIDQTQYFSVDLDISMRMQNRIIKRFSNEVLEKLYWASLSESPSLGSAFVDFIRGATLHKGDVLEAAFIDEALFEVVRLSRQVIREYHKLLGLTRFTQTAHGVYIGAIEPLYNILTPLSQHFTERLNDQKWILCDGKRQRAVFYSGQEVWEGPFNPEKLPVLVDVFESYWQNYYNAISIEARKNDKRRQAFMPKRYWSNLTELKTSSIQQP